MEYHFYGAKKIYLQRRKNGHAWHRTKINWTMWKNSTPRIFCLENILPQIQYQVTKVGKVFCNQRLVVLPCFERPCFETNALYSSILYWIFQITKTTYDRYFIVVLLGRGHGNWLVIRAIFFRVEEYISNKSWTGSFRWLRNLFVKLFFEWGISSLLARRECQILTE